LSGKQCARFGRSSGESTGSGTYPEVPTAFSPAGHVTTQPAAAVATITHQLNVYLRKSVLFVQTHSAAAEPIRPTREDLAIVLAEFDNWFWCILAAR
jgi:hypothetical protein